MVQTRGRGALLRESHEGYSPVRVGERPEPVKGSGKET